MIIENSILNEERLKALVEFYSDDFDNFDLVKT